MAKINKYELLEKIRDGIIVSCQALEDEPLYGSEIMTKMAKAALLGGAKGIRANSIKDINAIIQEVDLPVIGIIKNVYKGSECYITPTMVEVSKLVEQSKANIIAVDGTGRLHPNGETGDEFVASIKKKYPSILLMADISTLEEGILAQKAGADMVSTTLSGYTSYSPQISGPDYNLMKECIKKLSITVIGEGRIWCPEEAERAFQLGVFAVVVGTAITRPMEITRRFVEHIQNNSNIVL